MKPSDPSIRGTYAQMHTIDIPANWSAEQALVVWEFLEEISRCVWERYELPLLELIRPDLYAADSQQFDLFDPDDDIPF